MRSQSTTSSQTTTITAGDVREVMSLLTQEIETICAAAAQLSRDFDADDAMIDCSLLALNDVISTIRLQLYLGDELIREYTFEIADGLPEASGPPAHQPPLGEVPEGAHVRLAVSPNPRKCGSARNEWLGRLGWQVAEPLHRPGDLRHEVYGAHVSGGYGVTRHLYTNPRYDRPVGPVACDYTRKKG
jgi:hypothetical protein